MAVNNYDALGVDQGGDMIGSNNLSEVTDEAAARANIGVAGGTGDMLVSNNLSELTPTASTARSNISAGTLDTVAVSDLDNGTDGAIITWDNLGVATIVIPGTSGFVLTSNGAGSEPTWQAAGGGVGAIDDLSDVTITTPADADLLLYDVGTSQWRDATMSGDATIGDTGVITVAVDAIAYAKMQNVVADERLLGNIAGAGGIITELTPTQVRTMINVANGATVDQTSIVGITGSLAQFNTALTDATLATGGGTASGTNTGDEAAASLTVAGVIEVATGAETNTGTDATRAVSPDGLDDWTGSAQVTMVGTIATGTWNGTAINQTYLVGQSGTNTGDQTSIVGITGTLAQFNTAITDATLATGGGTASGTNTGDQTITLTGDVTGSGTGSFAATIAAQSVDVAMLSDGVDGELITWSATGVAATVAVGTVGQTLTSGGIGVAPTFQSQDAELAAIAGLTSAADRVPYFTGLGTAALATLTSAGRDIIDDADVPAQRTTLGLGGMALKEVSIVTFATYDAGPKTAGTLYFTTTAS